MKRFVNFRPLLILFFCFIGAVYSVINIFLGNIVPIIIYSVFLLFNLILLILSVFKIKILDGFLKVFGIKSVKIISILVLVTATITAGLSALSFTINSKRDLKSDNYTITASVKEVSIINGSTKLLLGNVKIDGKTYKFNIKANVDDAFCVGDVLEFTAYLTQSKLVTNGKINTSVLKSKVHYYCSINADEVAKKQGRAILTDKLKDDTKHILFNNLSEENAGFCYTVLFGDKSLLSENYNLIFKNGGLAHILAVSGLHIGIFVSVLLFLLKKFKVKKKYQFFVILIILLIYNILCNFSASVFRASVMSLSLMLGMILGERNDSLSNISFAGIIVLLFQPLYLFDIGFLLSFGSVFGIILFANMFSKLLAKIKPPQFLCSSISVMFGATLGALPWICRYFGKFAPITFISNLIVLPLFTIMFIVLLFAVFINLMISAPLILHIAQFFVNIVTNWSGVFAKFGMIEMLNFSIISVCIYYFVCFLISPYVMMTVKSKCISSLCFVLLLSTSLGTCNASRLINSNSVYFMESASNSLFFTTKQGKTVLCNVESDDFCLNNVKNMLKNNRVKNLDYILIFNYNQDLQNNVANISNTFNAKNVCVFGDFDNGAFLGLSNSLYSSNILSFIKDDSVNFADNTIKIDIYKNANKNVAVKYNINGNNILQILGSVTNDVITQKNIFSQNYKYLYAKNFKSSYSVINSKIYICQKVNGFAQNVEVLQDDELLCYVLE